MLREHTKSISFKLCRYFRALFDVAKVQKYFAKSFGNLDLERKYR